MTLLTTFTVAVAAGPAVAVHLVVVGPTSDALLHRAPVPLQVSVSLLILLQLALGLPLLLLAVLLLSAELPLTLTAAHPVESVIG